MSCSLDIVLFLFQSSNPPNTKRFNGRISCLALAENIWHIFHGRNPHTQLCCSSFKCMFPTNGAPFERELYRLSNGIRFIAKKHWYHRGIINQTQISLYIYIYIYLCCQAIKIFNRINVIVNSCLITILFSMLNIPDFFVPLIFLIWMQLNDEHTNILPWT